MAWIESHQSLGQHPKTLRMAKELKLSPVAVVGHLHFLWWWAFDYAQDGYLKQFSAEEVATAAQWTRDPEKFMEALRAARFVDEDSKLHDWEQYGGKLLAKRRANASRMAKVRSSSSHVQDTSATHVQDTFDARAEHGASHVQNGENARATLEERRVEENREVLTPTGVEVGSTVSDSARSKPRSAPISERQTAILERLQSLSGWDTLTFAAIQQANGRYGRDVATKALEFCWEERQPPDSSAYALFNAVCGRLAKESA